MANILIGMQRVITNSVIAAFGRTVQNLALVVSKFYILAAVFLRVKKSLHPAICARIQIDRVTVGSSYE
jgi:hypothetical protein